MPTCHDDDGADFDLLDLPVLVDHGVIRALPSTSAIDYFVRTNASDQSEQG